MLTGDDIIDHSIRVVASLCLFFVVATILTFSFLLRQFSRSVRLTGNSSLVFIDPSALRRTTTANAAVAAAQEPHTMATTASSLARAFGIVLRQVCQLFNTITELYSNGLLHSNNSMNITYQEANQLHVS